MPNGDTRMADKVAEPAVGSSDEDDARFLEFLGDGTAAENVPGETTRDGTEADPGETTRFGTNDSRERTALRMSDSLMAGSVLNAD